MAHPLQARLQTLVSVHWPGLYPDAMSQIARNYAIQFKSADLEADAQLALSWLWHKLPDHLSVFVQPAGTLDEEGLLRWSRTVIRNKLYELRRHSAEAAQLQPLPGPIPGTSAGASRTFAREPDAPPLMESSLPGAVKPPRRDG